MRRTTFDALLRDLELLLSTFKASLRSTRTVAHAGERAAKIEPAL